MIKVICDMKKKDFMWWDVMTVKVLGIPVFSRWRRVS